MEQVLSIRNNTDYFDITRSRITNYIPKTTSFSYESNRRRSYEQRLWYEVDFVNSIGGQCFFYTLTYANNRVPKYLGLPCFSYDDIRDLTAGGFSKYILRNYGMKLRYFVACESGEGAGIRGIGNNPHYHTIFFLTPDTKSLKKVVRKVDPVEFRRLVRKYWQGSQFEFYDKSMINQSNKSFLKYGIVEEGRNYGLIDHFSACSYVAKYVVKDTGSKQMEEQMKKIITVKSYVDGQFNQDIYDELYREYKSKHSPKVRVSNGVGQSLVDNFIELDNKYYIKMPTNEGYKLQPISGYAYRKAFYDYHIDPHTHNVFYSLNDRGKRYKLANFESDIKSQKNKIINSIDKFLDKDYYNKMWRHYNEQNKADLVDPTFLMLHRFPWFKKNIDTKKIEKYVIYKKVYENRFYSNKPDVFGNVCPECDYKYDYSQFLDNTHFTTKYSPNGRSVAVANDGREYSLYSHHPHFAPDIELFVCLDHLVDYEGYLADKHNKEQFDEKVRLKKFHRNQI